MNFYKWTKFIFSEQKLIFESSVIYQVIIKKSIGLRKQEK